MNPKPSKNRYSLTVAWLYPDLMSTYGDRGNIISLQKRCSWREIDVQVKFLGIGSSAKELSSCDILFMGGGEDKQQQIVAEDMKKIKAKAISIMIEDDTPGLYICGAYQFLGKYYKKADGSRIEGLGIFDLYTENPGGEASRLIGNVAAKIHHPDLSLDTTIIGFENHGGRTFLGKDVKPLGKILKGHGNNGQDGSEGTIYKNSIGSYFHGPLLPKNPKIADFLIKKALEKKYQKSITLISLDDTLEKKAQDAIARRMKVTV